MKVSGLDVHKDSVFCGIYDGKKQKEVKEFPTFTCDIIEMLKKEGVKKDCNGKHKYLLDSHMEYS